MTLYIQYKGKLNWWHGQIGVDVEEPKKQESKFGYFICTHVLQTFALIPATERPSLFISQAQGLLLKQ